MGCASSNKNDSTETSKNAKNGNNNNNNNSKTAKQGEAEAAEPAPPKQNPYMSLTHKDIFHLKMSWKGIRRCLEETGVAMFISLFQTHPDAKNHFEKFKNINIEVLAKNEKFIDNANNVMEAIDTAVTELDDAEKTHSKLKKIGLDHKNRQIPDTLILAIRDPFLKAVEQTLGDRYSDRMRSIYEVFADYLVKAIAEGYNG